MEIVEKQDNKIVFKENIDISLANAIRRSALEIPILAIDEVEFHKNDSALHDEIMALRLGLLPLKTPSRLKLPEECKCEGEGCKKCMVQAKLKAKGPGTVYAKDIEGNIDVVYPDMPIVKLVEGQEIEMVLNAKLGKGLDHTKYSPGLVHYHDTPEIEEINKSDIEDNERVIEVDEDSFEEIKGKKSDKVKDYMNDIVKNGDNYIRVNTGNSVTFYIESWGQIAPEEILEKSVEALEKNLKEVEKAK